MKGMFEKDFLKMEEGSDSNYPTSYPCKIEDGVEMGFVDQIEMDYQNKSFFPEEFDYEDESLTESRTFEKIEIKTEEDERKLLASYKQLTKRKPLEGPKRKVLQILLLVEVER